MQAWHHPCSLSSIYAMGLALRSQRDPLKSQSVPTSFLLKIFLSVLAPGLPGGGVWKSQVLKVKLRFYLLSGFRQSGLGNMVCHFLETHLAGVGVVA